jgi:hypothetical protein
MFAPKSYPKAQIDQIGGYVSDSTTVPLPQLLRGLTLGNWIAISSSVAGVLAVAFYFGSNHGPDAKKFKDEISRLERALSQTQIAGGNIRELGLDKFIVSQQADTANLRALHGDRLFAPDLPSPWIAMPASQNDISVLASATELSVDSVRLVMPNMWQFNEKHPPLLWRLTPDQTETDFGRWFPYIQISLIRREDAQALMRSVSKDSQGLGFAALDAIKAPFYRHLSAENREVFDERLDQFVDPTQVLRAFVASGLPAQERGTFFSSLGPSEKARDAQLSKLADDAAENLMRLFQAPTSLALNGISTLSEVTPESGLLFGRLLFYVFAVSNTGRVDIESLVVGYNGSYARTRRAVSYTTLSGTEETKYVFDHILILSTKSDFCLVHIRMPHFSDRLRDLDQTTQAWIKQLRLQELR